MSAREWKRGDRVLVPATFDRIDRIVASRVAVVLTGLADGSEYTAFADPNALLSADEHVPDARRRRERIAMVAFQGMLANPRYCGFAADPAKAALELADALIAALDAKDGGR